MKKLLAPALVAIGLLFASVGNAAITYIGTSAVVQSSSTITPVIPSGNTGDLILCTAALRAPSYTLPTPSSATYTELVSGSTWSYHKVWGRIATGTDTFTLASLPGNAEGWCSRFRGTSSSLSSIVDVGVATRVSSLKVRVGTTAPTIDNDVLWYSARYKGPATSSPGIATPTSFTEDVDSYFTSADMLMSGGHWIQTTKTTSSQQDLTVSPAAAAVADATSIVLALSPSGTGGGGGGSIWSLVGYGTPVGIVASFTGTPPLPTGHTAGDWLCWFGYERDTTLTLAHPAGYTNIISRQVGGHDVSAIDCKIDNGAEVAPTTTFGSSGMAQMAAWRGGPSVIAGNVNATNSNGSTCTTSPASASLSVTQSNTLVISFATQNANYTSFTPSTGVPAGFATGAADSSVTTTTSSSQDTSFLIAYYLYPSNTTLAASNFTDGNTTSVSCRSHIAAILPNTSTPAITGINAGTNIFAAGAVGVVILGTNFGAVTGTVNVTDGTNSCPQTVTAWADTSITITSVLGNCRYGARNLRVVRTDNAFNDHDVTITAGAGKCYFDTGTLVQPFTVDAFGAPNRFGDASNDITDNSQLEFSAMTFTSGSTCANITVNADGSYKVPVDLTTLTWLWNNGTGGWKDTGVGRTGQGKVHIRETNGFRLSCSNTSNTGSLLPPTRGTPTKTICASGCDYSNTTAGITACMGAISNGQVCEMRSGTTDGSTDKWPAQIKLASITGAEGSVKTLWVRDPDSITLTVATTGTEGLIDLTNVNYVNIQGNSTGQDGLILGDQSLWLTTCAHSSSASDFTPPVLCYPNARAINVTTSTNIGLMNLTAHGGNTQYANEFNNTSSYIYLRQDAFSLHGINDNKAPTNASDTGTLLRINADRVLMEDTILDHSGMAAAKVTGSFTIFRRVIINNRWDDFTSSTTYTGNQTLAAAPNDCSDGAFGCSPYGPQLYEDSDFYNSGLTPNHTPSNTAIRLRGLGIIFRKNYVYLNYHNYLLDWCSTEDSSTTAYRDGEQTIYNNTLWGGAPLFVGSSTFPSGISTSICQNVIVADNLFQGAQPGPAGGSYVYAFSASYANVPLGSFANAWKGAKIFSNIFGIDPSAPSLNMQVNLTGTGSGTKLLTDSATWPSNFYNNRNLTLKWANGTTSPAQDRTGLIPSNTNTAGIGDNAAITSTTGAGAATTVVPLASARPFKDDWGFSGHTFGSFHTEFGDCIAVGPLTTSTVNDAVSVRIAASGVNYTNNQVTVISAISFQSGSPVWKAIDNFDGTCGRAYQNRGAAQ